MSLKNKFVQWQLDTGQLDHWTSYHLAAGAFICKVAQWLGASDLWAVLLVVIIGLAWEIYEWFVESYELYGGKSRWAWNTAADLFVETAIAIWIVI
tara:strand:- start:207 stop:494 length:288 start_codon:yes stop_codon:yes gene_type:complete